MSKVHQQRREKNKERNERELVSVDMSKMLPAAEVAKQLGYTKDYILMNLRNGNISGLKIGNKWYATKGSAETYFEKAKKEREANRKKLSKARKKELQKHQKPATATPRFTPSPIKISKKVAIFETAAVMFVGVFLGAFGYVGVGTVSEYAVAEPQRGIAESVALAVHDMFLPLSEFTTMTAASIGSLATEKDNDALDDVMVGMQVGTTTYTSVIISSDEVLQKTQIDSVEEAVQQTFSDDVEVMRDPESEGEVIVTPQFVDGEGEAQRFKILPVDNENTQ